MPSFRLRKRTFSIPTPFKKDDAEKRDSGEEKRTRNGNHNGDVSPGVKRQPTLRIQSLDDSEFGSSDKAEHLRVIIIGAGLGGLAAAIACRKRNVNVTLLERTAGLEAPDAGIEIPPNASGILRYFGVHRKLEAESAIQLENYRFKRYSDGHDICVRFLREDMVKRYGHPWLVVSRSDYQKILVQQALEAGAYFGRAAEVVEIDDSVTPYNVVLRDGRRFIADVVIGADGPHSNLRSSVVDKPYPVRETGQTVWHGDFSVEQLQACNDPKVQDLISQTQKTLWLGPDKHVVFFPLRSGERFNLVMWTPNDPSRDGLTAEDRLDEIKTALQGWDPMLTTMVSCLEDVDKRKISDHDMLDTWVKSPIALVGEAAHPSLPFQAQGAAMSVEDGAVLGTLLGKLDRSGRFGSCNKGRDVVSSALKLYETMRIPRVSQMVQAAEETRHMCYLPDGKAQQERDEFLSNTASRDWSGTTTWIMASAARQQELLGLKVILDTEAKFDEWLTQSKLEKGNIECKIED